MALLRKSLIMMLVTFLGGCGDGTITEIYELETDTFIDSASTANHAELDYLAVSSQASKEQRIIVKLPTMDEKLDDVDGLNIYDPLFMLELIFYMAEAVFYSLMGCTDEDLDPSDLLSAVLVFDEETPGAANALNIAGIQLSSLSKAWWQSVNWSQAHPFSRSGRWSTPGGDTDGNTPVAGAAAGSTIEFDVRSYFQNLISNIDSTPHYGFLIQSPIATETKLISTQSDTTLSRPRVEATYDCTRSSGSLRTHWNLAAGGKSIEVTQPAQMKRVTVLGKEPIYFDVPVEAKHAL